MTPRFPERSSSTRQPEPFTATEPNGAANGWPREGSIPSAAPHMETLVSIDTESELIAPGLQAPPLVCLQWETAETSAIVHARLERIGCRNTVSYFLWPDKDWIVTGHHVAFDMAVIGAHFPELIPMIFDAYEMGRIRCSLIREQLLDIAEGTRKKLYGLEDVANRYPGVPGKNAKDTWRLRFAELANVPVDQWPVEARDYALGDVHTQRAVYLRQNDRGARFAPDVFVDECRQSAAAFWLYLASCWGVHTDPKAVDAYYNSERARLENVKGELIAAGLVKPDGVRNMKAAQALMIEACRDADIPCPMTDGGVKGNPTPQLSEDAINLTGNELLAHFQQYGASKTLLSRIERLRYGAQYPIQPRFTTLQGTGRTSCSTGDSKPGSTGLPSSYGYQVQNTKRGVGEKECFIPRPGCWFLSNDYTGHELRTWAFACFKILGFSRLMEVLNSGKDPHADLAGSMGGTDYETTMAILHGSQGPERAAYYKDKLRQTAKIANFGFPGGMGPKRMVIQARTEYNVPLTLDEATNLRDAWRENWPEALAYFQFVNQVLAGGDTATVQHLLSGRYRGGISYCEICNSFFQGLAADISKEAGFHIARACYVAEKRSPLYGCRTWNFVHDEFLLEVPADPYRATLAGREVERIMVETAARWMPELAPAIEAKPTLMLRWSKKAVEKYARSGPFAGCLIPSEWDEQTGEPK